MIARETPGYRGVFSPAVLPSEESALVLIRSGLGPALPGLARNVLERAALIAIGLHLARVRPMRHLVTAAIAGALVVEVGVIQYVRRHATRGGNTDTGRG